MEKQVTKVILAIGLLLLGGPSARAEEPELQMSPPFSDTLTPEEKLESVRKEQELKCQSEVEKSVGVMTAIIDGPYARGVWAEYYCPSISSCLKNVNFMFYDMTAKTYCERCIARSCWTGPSISNPFDTLLVTDAVWEFQKSCELTAGDPCSQFN